MGASAGDVLRIRRMVAEPTSAGGYTDAVLESTIERYPTADASGLFPGDEGWSDTYDLNAAASDVWSEKAAATVGAYDFSADGSTFSRSQHQAQAAKMARYYAARRSASTMQLVTETNVDGGET
jgi:hypothetical protein